MRASVFCFAVLLSASASVADAQDLAPNPGFEAGTDEAGLPRGWWLWGGGAGAAGCWMLPGGDAPRRQ